MIDDEGIKREDRTAGTPGEPDQWESQRYPVTIFIPQTTIEEYRADQKENRNREKQRYRLEKVAVLVAAFYAAVTFFMWRTSLQATNAAKASADAAAASVRAWLVLTDIDTDEGSDPKTPEGDIHFINVGKTPATNILGYVEFRVPIPGPNFNPVWSKCPSYVARRDPVLATNATSAIRISPPSSDQLTRDEITRLDSGKMDLFIHGCITYHDIIDPDWIRLTEFYGWNERAVFGATGESVGKPHWVIGTLRMN